MENADEPAPTGSDRTPPPARAEFSALVERWTTDLLAFLLARAGRDAAEDALQETWTRAWANWESFDGKQSKAWLFRIAKNILIDRSRRERHQPTALTTDPAARETSAPSEDLDHLGPCVDALPTEMRDIVKRRLATLSFTELAAELKIPENTAMTRYHRAKERLRECLERRRQ